MNTLTLTAINGLAPTTTTGAMQQHELLETALSLYAIAHDDQHVPWDESNIGDIQREIISIWLPVFCRREFFAAAVSLHLNSTDNAAIKSACLEYLTALEALQ